MPHASRSRSAPLTFASRRRRTFGMRASRSRSSLTSFVWPWGRNSARAGGGTGKQRAVAALRGGSAFFEMSFLSAIALRPVRVALGTSIGALGISIGATGAGCLAAYPPDLPSAPAHRPTILPNESPEVDVPLVQWPAQFTVYVEVDPGQSFVWAPFLDYDPVVNPNP